MNLQVKSRRRGAGGFNLIEVIFAASLLSLVILMMFNLFPSSLLTIRQAEHRLEATSLAQSILEEKRAGPFSQLSTPPVNTRLTGDDGVVYNAAMTVSPVAGTDPTRLQSVQVTVTWIEREKPHTITQELYICDINQ